MSGADRAHEANGSICLSAGTHEKLIRVGAANVANALLAHGFRNVLMHGVTPLWPGQQQLVGPAYTLRFIPAREDMDSMAAYSQPDNKHRRAMEEAPPGAVLVIDAFGSRGGSSMGDMMATRLVHRGVAGVVTDGGYRDASAIRATGLPCYQRGSAPAATPIAMHPIALNEPIGCAGVAVYPGDVLVGDADGVVVIPQHLADQVAAEAYDAVQYEQFASQQLRDGASLFGTFPATTESRKQYDEWVASGHPETE